MTANGMHHERPSAEQRAFFEALVVMRGRYASRSSDDAMPVMSLHHAIGRANALMADGRLSGTSRVRAPHS